MTGPIPYIGGKNRLAARTIKLFPRHTAYVEPFAGGAQVLFRKKPSKVEVLNDLNHDIVTFYRVCQSHHEELIRYLHYTVSSREWFELHRDTDPRNLTDVQRAARFLYLQKNAFGGHVVKQHFGYSSAKPPTFNPDRTPAIIEAVHKRLARVLIESLPYEQILERYDSPTTLFYLDPPYWERKIYRFNFKPEDFRQLADRLGRLKGKFFLSLDDHPMIRQIFGAFQIRRTKVAYSAQRTGRKQYGELFITKWTRPTAGRRSRQLA